MSILSINCLIFWVLCRMKFGIKFDLVKFTTVFCIFTFFKANTHVTLIFTNSELWNIISKLYNCKWENDFLSNLYISYLYQKIRYVNRATIDRHLFTNFVNMRNYNLDYKFCCCYFSVSMSNLTICNPMNYSTPGFSVLQFLPEFAQTNVHLSQWCNPTVLSSVASFSSFPKSFPASGPFPMNCLFASGG